MTDSGAIAAELARTPCLAAAWVFGSVARDEARADSDLDVAVLLRDPNATALTEHRTLRDLAARLQQASGRPIDLVVLGLHDPILSGATRASPRTACGRAVTNDPRRHEPVREGERYRQGRATPPGSLAPAPSNCTPTPRQASSHEVRGPVLGAPQELVVVGIATGRRCPIGLDLHAVRQDHRG